MGHRKKSAPRRGSLAYRPRGRTSRLVARVRTWPEISVGRPSLLGFASFKAGMTHIITVDDREKTPNFGKPLFNSATVLAAPPLKIIGFRAYRIHDGNREALVEGYVKDLPKMLTRKVRLKPKPIDRILDYVESQLDMITDFTALAYVEPREAGLSQKKPFIFEIGIGGGDLKERFEYLKSILGNEVKVSDILKSGEYIDVAAITKGKGFEGPITRFGVKRKQAKSRKSVRAVAVLGPWHPAGVMYTVPRAGQRGFHQRTEYNKKVIAIGNSEDMPITPKGGFPHFGVVDGDYLIVKGSVPGPGKRLVRLRFPLRAGSVRVQPPKILEIGVRV